MRSVLAPGHQVNSRPSRGDPGGPEYPESAAWLDELSSQKQLKSSRAFGQPAGTWVALTIHGGSEMASGWTAREEVLTVGRTVLLGAAWVLATACTYLTEDGGVVFAEDDAMALELPDNCEAHRTASGYTVSCSEGSADAAAGD